MNIMAVLCRPWSSLSNRRICEGTKTNAPIEVVNWINEEGARFAPPMLAPGVFAGVFTHDYAYARTDHDGKAFGEELERISYKGTERARSRKFGAHFELHIEQGPILEAEQCVIGIVQGTPGTRWYEITLTGQDAHSGSTPMTMRKDALLGAARMIDRIATIARDHAPHAVGTVGLIENTPNSRNVNPGEVFFTVDFRHPSVTVLDAMEAQLRAALVEVTKTLNLSHSETRIWDCSPVRFSPELIDCVRAGATKAGLSARDIISGANHDSVYVSRVAPTTMIFVPCRGGISHNESEWSEPEHRAAGAQVLLNAVLEYDRKLQ